MKGEELLEKMELIEPDLVEAAENKPRKKRKRWLAWAAAAVCAAIAACVTAGILLGKARNVQPQLAPLKLSEGTTADVEYGYGVFGNAPEPAPCTEREMLLRSDIVIFRGKVGGSHNIIADFNGEKECYCVLQVGVDEVIKGVLNEDGAVRLLIPHGVSAMGGDYSDVISQVDRSIDCIFIAKIYNADSRIENNGAVLMLKDVADCGTEDGMRWAFLALPEGVLLFDRDAYPGAGGAKNLDNIEAYIKRMLG